MGKARNQTTVATPPNAPRDSGDINRERIANRAYELYMARGGADGQDLQDWLEAEREVEGERASNRDR